MRCVMSVEILTKCVRKLIAAGLRRRSRDRKTRSPYPDKWLLKALLQSSRFSGSESLLVSADVAGVVQAEWTRRRTSNTTSALFVKRNNNKSDNNKTRNHIFGPNPALHCEHGHTTADCFVRKHLEKEKAEGREAVETSPTDNTVANANYSSDSSAFIANANFVKTTATQFSS